MREEKAEEKAEEKKGKRKPGRLARLLTFGSGDSPASD